VGDASRPGAWKFWHPDSSAAMTEVRSDSGTELAYLLEASDVGEAGHQPR
jgi:hypothetical protein